MKPKPRTAIRTVSGSTYYPELKDRVPAPTTQKARDGRKRERANRRRGRS